MIHSLNGERKTENLFNKLILILKNYHQFQYKKPVQEMEMIVTSRIQIGVHYQYPIYTLENSKQKQICKIVRTFLKYDLVYLDSVNI